MGLLENLVSLASKRRWTVEKRLLHTDLRAIATAVDAVPAPVVGETYTEVTVSSAQLLAIGGAAIQLLPAPGANKYYEFRGSIEYIHGGSDYTFNAAGDSFSVLDVNASAGSLLDKNLINFVSTNSIGFFRHDGDIETTDTNSQFHMSKSVFMNSAVSFGSWSGNSPTGGNGTMLIKIYSIIKTLGTEL